MEEERNKMKYEKRGKILNDVKEKTFGIEMNERTNHRKFNIDERI